MLKADHALSIYSNTDHPWGEIILLTNTNQ